ncbi:MAG: hypothetical protein QM778_25010 [Myxococcales bacterium]
MLHKFMEICVVELPRSVTPLRSVRSTLIQSSITALRNHGHQERYLARLNDLSPEHRERIVGSLAPEWLPVNVALAHYEACDELGLSENEVAGLGEEVGERVQGTFMGTLLRGARSIGLTPWTPIGQLPRLWDRVFQGGGIGVTKRGPTDALIELREMTLARTAYFRSAVRGVFMAGIKVCGGRQVTVREFESPSPGTRLQLRAEWV